MNNEIDSVLVGYGCDIGYMCSSFVVVWLVYAGDTVLYFFFFAIIEPSLWWILNAIAGWHERKAVMWISIAIAFVMALVLGRFVPGSEERLLRSFIIILSNIGWSMSGFVEGVIVRQFKEK